MDKVTLRYKKPEWADWVYFPCPSREIAERWREELEARGYIVEGL